MILFLSHITAIDKFQIFLLILFFWRQMIIVFRKHNCVALRSCKVLYLSTATDLLCVLYIPWYSLNESHPANRY